MASNVYDVLKERGFLDQVTDEAAVRALFETERVTVYTGYDPTADSLHVGHLLPTMALMHLQRAGHRPVVLVGGGTAMVGDPSGKTEMREMLPAEAIGQNSAKLKTQLGQLIDVGDTKGLALDNAEWLLGLNYVEFLRDIGRHFSVNRMLSAEAYKLRMERGLSFIEFNYQLLQAYDFLELYRRHDCKVQMGGSDQWGNIVAGIDLCRRVAQGQVYGVTFPLLTTAAGEKMGKTASGAVWLDPDKLSPYDYYQYWVNTHDADVARLLAVFTFLPMGEVEQVADMIGSELNVAKAILAFEATQIVHGRDAAEKAHHAAQAAFGGRAIPASILPASTVPRAADTARSEIPTTELTAAEVSGGKPLVELLATASLAKSKNEARRLIRQKAIRLDDEVVSDEGLLVKTTHFVDGQLLLRAGKKRVHRLVLLS